MMNEGTLFLILAAWLVVMSLILFFTMGSDKRRAQKERRRVPEKTLFLLALLGGGLGGVIGMSVFRHKTKHVSFQLGMPLLLVLNLGVAFLLLWLNRGA